MLWIALYLPELPLQLARISHQLPAADTCEKHGLAQRGHELSGPCIIVEGPATRPVVCCANAVAREQGVFPGMPVAAARALARELTVLQRSESAEAQALHNLACWAGQFTPNVALEAAGLLLEIGSTLRLHGGLSQLLARIRHGVAELGYQTIPGVAPTPLAASILARARQYGLRVRMCRDPALLPERLNDLPLALLDWPDEIMKPLQALGIRRIGQCLELPRDGFIRRFGRERRLELDRAIGALPDPRLWFMPPDTFSSRVEFGFEVADALTLLFPLKRLLGELEGFLRGRGSGVQQWQVLLEHMKQDKTCITVGTAAPERSTERLLVLAREHLAQTPLTAPVLALGLKAEQLLSFEESNQSFIPDPRSRALGWGQLIDKLNARLGSDRIYRLQALDDHRPEHAWKRNGAAVAGRSPVPKVQAPRPLWLLSTPHALTIKDGEPLYQGRLRMLAGPERIETGWWDGHDVHRDYYVARNAQGETLWIYREHRRNGNWYLQGIFS